MSDSMQSKRQDKDKEGSIDLTTRLQSLKLPKKDDNEIGEYLENQRKVMLASSDAEIRKWGRRWLEREGLDVVLVDDPAKCIYTAKTVEPHVIVIETGFGDVSGKPFLKVLEESTDVAVPVIALSNNSKDLSAALESEVYDIARKPFEWKLIARRASMATRVADTERELDEVQNKLAEALDVAEGARVSLRSHESFEPVTGLPNKRKFLDLLSRGMGAVDRDENVLAVFVVGFNRFRLVVEAMGQDSADLVLNEIGQRLSLCLESVDLFQTMARGLRTSAASNIDVARFALMMTCSGDEDELADMQQELVTQLSRPVNVAGQTVYLSACVGVALYPQDAADADSLLQRADNAMRDAQSRGGGFKFYCPATDAAAARKLKLEHMLHEALNASELEVYYQPIIDAHTGGLASSEALLRWTQPDGTTISPSEFIPVAEESGLMNRVGEFVLDQACCQLSEWLERGVDVPHVCVNVAKAQLMHGGFVATVRRILQKHDLESERLVLELSERGVLSGDLDVVTQLHDVRSLGVRLSIDDFGTGDSAIAYLRELPVDILKIDRSYVNGLPDNDKDKAIIAAMIAMGHSLDLRIVAEGIETREQLRTLRELGCDELQGFFISRAVDEHAFPQLLKRSK